MHLNVILSEAHVGYDALITEVDDANAALAHADVAIVIGGNDIVNPSAIDQPGSPIYGMPIIDVRKAQSVIVIKRSMAAGFSGVANPLFFYERTAMLFGDAKPMVEAVIKAVKELD